MHSGIGYTVLVLLSTVQYNILVVLFVSAVWVVLALLATGAYRVPVYTVFCMGCLVVMLKMFRVI